MKRNMFNAKALNREQMKKVSGGGGYCGSCRIRLSSYGCFANASGACKCSGSRNVSCSIGGGIGPIGLGDTSN